MFSKKKKDKPPYDLSDKMLWGYDLKQEALISRDGILNTES